MLPQILDRGTIDVVLNGYEWSEERERLWSSTIPYYIYKLQLMARTNDDSIRRLGRLARAGRPGAQARGRAAGIGRRAIC